MIVPNLQNPAFCKRRDFCALALARRFFYNHFMPLALIKKIFFFLAVLSLLSVLALFRDLSFPFITSKALWFRSMALFALPVYAYLLLAEKQLRPNFKNPLNIAVLLFLLANTISAWQGVNFSRSLWGNYERMGGLWYLLHLTLLYFYLEALAKISGIKFQKILKLLALLGAAAGFYALITKLGFPPWPFPDSSLPARASGFFGNPIFFASFLIFPAFLSAFFAAQAEKNSNSRKLWLGIFLINLTGIYLSATRGAFLGLLAGFGAGFFLWFWLNKNLKRRLYGLGAIACVLAAFLILIAFSKSLPEGSILRRLTDFGDSNTRARVIQWSAGLKGFKENPIFGVGPENYYVIGNRHFNSEIYQYDRSWFDKPHNYPLEVLLTAGSLGFLAYLSIVVFSFFACYKAYRSEMITRLEFAVLAAGIAAYQIQNLFVFETPSASVSFFAFAAFMAFLWQASLAGPQKQEAKNKFSPPAESYKYFSLALAAASFYVWYLTGLLPARAMAKLNDAVSVGTRNPMQAKLAFDQAIQAPMNFDLNETATKYEEFASEFSLFFQDKKDRPAVIEAVKGALAAMEKAVAKTGNDPILWFKLTNLRATLAHLTGAPYDEKLEESAKKGVDLAPNRVEPRYFLVQTLQVKKDFAAAIGEQQNVIKIDFNNPFNFWRLALVYREARDFNRAYRTALYARKNGYEFRNLAETQWLAKYFADLNQFGELKKIYQELIKNELADFQTYANLATTYAKLGEKDKARDTAVKVLQLNPSAKADVDLFLKTLEGQ